MLLAETNTKCPKSPDLRVSSYLLEGKKIFIPSLVALFDTAGLAIAFHNHLKVLTGSPVDGLRSAVPPTEILLKIKSVILMSGLVFIFVASWKLSLVTLGCIPVVVLLIALFGKKVRNHSKSAKESLASLLAVTLRGAKARGAFLFLSLQTALFASAKPNFLIIYADDLGYGDVSTYHASDVATPNIDRLATEGMLFSQMRANCTVCSPSRAALLTGIYADRAGVPGVIRTDPAGSWGYLDPKRQTLADKLKQGGYSTAIIGKWHLGLESPNIPNERGFDHFHGFLGDMMDSYYSHRRGGKNFMLLDSETIDPKGHATELFSEWACDYLRERKDAEKPFFLYLAYNAPHYPIEPPKEWLAKVKARSPELNAKRARNVAFVEHLDHYIGTVLAALKETGLEKNTVVVFTSDNGGSLPHAQNNDPWRGGKQDHYDGGLKVPFAVRWPGNIKPGTRSDYEGLVFDVYPTFLQLAGVTPAPDLDAMSLVPILRGEDAKRPGDLYFVRREGGKYKGQSYHAVVKDGWKLMQNDPFSPLQLYHLSEDTKEEHDLADKEKAKVTELKALLDKHIAVGAATPWRPNSKAD